MKILTLTFLAIISSFNSYSFTLNDTLNVKDSTIEKSIQQILEIAKRTNKFLDNNKEIEKLEKENISLNEINKKQSKKIETLKQTKSIEIIKQLERESTSKSEKISSLKYKITTKDDEIEELKIELNNQKNKINRSEKYVTQEKENIISEIKYIIKQSSGTLSDKLLTILKKRAIKYKVDKEYKDDLNTYIEYNKIIETAKLALSKAYNKDNVSKQEDNLDDLSIENKFPALVEDAPYYSKLLSDYKNVCKSLSTKLDEFHSLKISSSEITRMLKLNKKDYFSYPYLLQHLNEKITNPKKHITIKCS